MKRWKVLLLPRSFYVTGATAYVGTLLLGVVILLISRPVMADFQERFVAILRIIAPIQRVLLIGLAALYGISRGSQFHPVSSISYRYWLSNTPWRSGDPFPLGPVALVWQDGLFLALILSLLAMVTHAVSPEPIIGLLAGYLVPSTLSLAKTGEWTCVAILLGLAPVIAYFTELWLIVALLLVMYVILFIGQQRSWRTFPWHDAKPFRQRSNNLSETLPGWPFNRLNGVEPKEPIRLRKLFTCAVLVAWYLFTFLHLNDDHDFRDPRATMTCVILVGCVASFFRMLIYLARQATPLTLLGRIWTLHFIVPGYDYMFLSPLLTATVAAGGAAACFALGVYPPIAAAGMTAVLIVLLFGLPPSMKHWDLTAHGRMLIKMHNRQRPR